MILIFDTVMGLCNQILDIQCAINFCNVNNYYFTFRNCSFRNKNDIYIDIIFIYFHALNVNHENSI